MLVNAAEQSFQKGMEFLNQGRHREALAFFLGALEIEKRMGADVPQARYLSYYGLAVALTGGRLHEAVKCCRLASKQEGYRPDVFFNLGRVLLMANRRREAFKALRCGQRMQPGHPGIIAELKRMGRRRKPIVPFLDRMNQVNVTLGRLRAWAAP